LKLAKKSGRLRLAAGTLLAAGTAGSMFMLFATVPAGAASAATGPNAGKVAVPQGVGTSVLTGHSVFPKPINPTTKEHVSFVLDVRNEARLESQVEAGMPGGYLSVAKFARQYGVSHSDITALVNYLKKFNIRSRAYADGLNVATTGSARDYNKALSVTQSDYTTKATAARGDQPARPAVTFHGTTDKPLLPAKIAKYVYAILGLTDYPVASSDALRTLTPEQRAPRAGLQEGNRTPASFAKQYGLSALYSKGAKGQGETIGVITYASMRTSDATHFWSSVLHIKTKANRIKLDNIDGGSGAVDFYAGSSETTLDVEQSGALAPDANIVVYQAPNTDYGEADAWYGAASSNVASTISTSWGESEILNEATADNGTEATTFNGVYTAAALEMAAQGQSTFDAAGDDGAYDDVGDTNPANGNSSPYTELSVDNPADIPWITAAGGTTEAGRIPLYDASGLAATVTIKSQRAWGWDWLFPYYYLIPSSTPLTEATFAANPLYATGGGGGYSVVERQPTYQSKIPGIDNYSFVPYESYPNCAEVPTPTGCSDYPGTTMLLPTVWTSWLQSEGVSSGAAPAAQTGTFTGAGGRAVPDVVADADPYTGYVEYFSKFWQQPGGGSALEDGWGGTSFVAPQLNGSTAVIDSYLHRRVGFWNPAIYKFAAKSYTPFTPLDTASSSNDNLYYTGTKGHIFNPGTGLGTPNLAKLAADFRTYGG
jgi:kumamolisin